MGYSLNTALPWGRSLQEYGKMFQLEEVSGLDILDCSGGPASVNAQLTRQGCHVISCDPIYNYSQEQINKRIQEARPQILGGIEQSADEYDWQDFSSVQDLSSKRMGIMDDFLSDYPGGLNEGRYVAGMLPTLPFDNEEFDMALCSYFLFSYSDTPGLGCDFHIHSILELLRVACEVRIFPVITLCGKISPWLAPVMKILEQKGFNAILEDCPYRFQKGAEQFLRVKRI